MPISYRQFCLYCFPPYVEVALKRWKTSLIVYFSIFIALFLFVTEKDVTPPKDDFDQRTVNGRWSKYTTLMQLKLINCTFFQCSLCDNSFCQQANLDRHVRKHQEQPSSSSFKSENTSEDEDEFVDLVAI